jgi:hypothetical protein
MTGVGSFLKPCRTLFVGGILKHKYDTPQKLEEALWKHFGEWGEVECVNMVQRLSIAFVRFRVRTSAGQSLFLSLVSRSVSVSPSLSVCLSLSLCLSVSLLPLDLIARIEFAKEAMINQSMDEGEILDIRWAHDDPNPVAQDAMDRANRDALYALMQAKGLDPLTLTLLF